MRDVTKEEVEIQLIVHEEDTPVRGNALASGDDAEDKRVEDEIIERLQDGDIWAWCCVEVRAVWRPEGVNFHVEGSDFLGACSYRDEQDFREDSLYFEDMVEQAVEDVNRQLELMSRACALLA